MLKLSNKRTFEQFEASHETPTTCSPLKISFLDSPPMTPAAKRIKTVDTESSPSQQKHTYFPKFDAKWETVPVEKWIEWTPRHRRRHHINKGSFVHGANGPTEPLFTLEDLKTILQNASREITEKQQAEYDAVMSQKLSEQFQGFTKFNEDHIHRKMSSSQYDYFL